MVGIYKAAEEALKERGCRCSAEGHSETGQVSLRGDALSPAFYRASVLLEAALRQQADRKIDRSQVARLAVESIAAGSGQSQGPQNSIRPVRTGHDRLRGPLMVIPQTAMLVSREVRRHTLERLQLAPVRTVELLAGISLAQLVVAAFQVVTITWLATAAGFPRTRLIMVGGFDWISALPGLHRTGIGRGSLRGKGQPGS